MKRVLLILALGGAVFMAASPAQAANGILQLGWNDACAPVSNLDWDGTTPFSANLHLGVIGADATNNGSRVRVVVGPNVPDAWRFDAGACQLGNWSANFPASKTCPVFTGPPLLSLKEYSFDSGTGMATIDISNTYSDFTPLPGTGYTLWQASFDHAFSVLGVGNPALVCQFAGNALCFAIRADHQILLAGGTTPNFDGISTGFVTWQDTGNAVGCPGVQAQTSTWGRIKNMYR